MNTTWNTSVIRLRYHLDLTGFTPEQMNALTGRIHHDEDVTVYFNSVVAFQGSGYLTAYKNISINQEALDALTPDDTNVIAIECTNKGGGQYIDFGLSGIRPIPTGINILTPDPVPVVEGSIYDLQGRKINRPQKGVNIIRRSGGTGKKVLVK